MIKLGDKVKDKLTGYSGTAVARAEYLYGCVWISVIPEELQDGKPIEDVWFDEGRLEGVSAEKDIYDKPMPSYGGPSIKMPKRSFPNPRVG